MVARAAAISAWAAADGTPDPQLQADLASAEAALKTVTLPAGAVFDQAVVAAARQWLSAVNPAASTASTSVVGAGLTYTLSVIPELATLASTLAANALQATNDLIPLAVTLEQTLTSNAATWLTTITPAATQAANEIADHTAQAQLTTSNALLTLTHQVVDNAVTATMAVTTADVAFTSAMGAIIVAWAGELGNSGTTSAAAMTEEAGGETLGGDAGVSEVSEGDGGDTAQSSVEEVAVSGIDWHHLLPQSLREEFWEILGIDVDEAMWGVLMNHADHAQLHPDWENDWNLWFEEFERSDKLPTRDDFVEMYNEMMQDERYKKHLKNGRKPKLGYKQWSGLSPDAKVAGFKRAGKVFAGLAAALGVLGAATDANAALAPALALEDPEARKDYESALRALHEGRTFAAHRALFGTGELADIYTKNPEGLIPKMLSRMYEANPAAANALGDLFEEAKRRFTDWASST